LVAIEPCDMREGFNGLYGLVGERLGEDPRSGTLFAFINRRHTRLKILYFDGTGPALFRFIGQEVSETLEYEPARFLCRRIVRRKYVSRTQIDKAPVIAALPESLQERCVAAPGLLAQLIVSKFCGHLPFYAGSGIMAYAGWQTMPISRSSSSIIRAS
jgi:transposase